MVKRTTKSLFRILPLGLRFIENALLVVCACIFMLLMFLGAGDVIGRFFFSRPITGAYELSTMMMGAIVLLGWAYTQRQGGHVAVELFYNKFPPLFKRAAALFSQILSLGLFAIITYKSWGVAMSHTLEGRSFQTLDLASGPFHFLVPIGGFLICLEIILGFFASSEKAGQP